MKRIRLDQPDMFTDIELVKPPTGTDAGMQSDMFGGSHLYQTLPTETVIEAVEIKQRHNLRKEEL